jgi:hypothetical protein
MVGLLHIDRFVGMVIGQWRLLYGRGDVEEVLLFDLVSMFAEEYLDFMGDVVLLVQLVSVFK